MDVRHPDFTRGPPMFRSPRFVLLLSLAAVPAGAQVYPVPAISRALNARVCDRYTLGLQTMATGDRDTAGLFVVQVTSRGPAERAGIVEGDRLTAADELTLRLGLEDVRDPQSRVLASRRLT